MTTNFLDDTGIRAIGSHLSQWIDNLSVQIAQFSQALDEQFGAEVTTAVAISLGLISLILAVMPFVSDWRQRQAQAARSEPPTVAELEAASDPGGDEIVQMHPERLQQLYGLAPLTLPLKSPELPKEQTLSSTPLAESMNTPEAVEPSSRQNDVTLALMADLSESLAQQDAQIKALNDRLGQQQQVIELLTAQLKAQSSAFLMQGERLLHLESSFVSSQDSVDAQGSIAPESSERLSTFDEAIRLAAAGASVERLMSECELSQSEARLVALVHGPHA